MFTFDHFRIRATLACSLVALAALAFCTTGCRKKAVRIAIIPQTTGTDLWGPVLNGAQSVHAGQPIHIYWNAPTSEDNVKAQISMLERLIRNRECDGIILAPDHSLALMNAVQDAMAAHIPVVVISSRLSLAPRKGLSYILNNDADGGATAARYLGTLLHAHGTVAIMGIDPALDGNMERTRSFELTLQRNDPDISIVERRFGSYNEPHEQQVAAEILKKHPHLSAIIALNPASERGAWFTLLDLKKTGQIHLIGFDQDIVLDGGPRLKIDGIVEQNTYEMGRMAVQQILKDLDHKPVPPLTLIEPELLKPQPATKADSQIHPSRGADKQP